MEKYLTAEGLEKFKKELDYLENTKRRELAERLRYAISFGDLKENAAYHEAKDAQAFMEGRILELKHIVATARVVQKSAGDSIVIGSTVVLHSLDRQDEFVIVDPQEADVFSNKLSYQSPLGAKLMKKNKGDKITLETPGGTIEYTILEVK
jgi:transcription elongation factor GreA